MPEITFSKEQKQTIIDKIQEYFVKELDQDLGQFDAEFLLDFFSKEMGAVYYNQGLYDAQAILSKQIDDITDAIYQIEKPVDLL